MKKGHDAGCFNNSKRFRSSKYFRKSRKMATCPICISPFTWRRFYFIILAKIESKKRLFLFLFLSLFRYWYIPPVQRSVDLPVPGALDWTGNYQYKVRDQTEYISKLETRYSSHQSRDPLTNTVLAIPVGPGARQYDDPWFSQSTSIVNCSVFHMIKIRLNF